MRDLSGNTMQTNIIHTANTANTANTASSSPSSLFMRQGKTKGLEHINTLAKMIISLVASVITIIFNSPEGLLSLFAFSLAYALFLPQLKVLFFAYIIAACMFTIALFFSYLLSLVVPMPFNTGGIAAPFLRLLVMLNVILPLAFSTRIQNILTTLKSLRLPFCIYLPAAVMIRFIPTFLYDIKQVAETLRIRGYSMTVGETMRHPLTMIRLLFTPLLFRSLRTSEDLGIAGELKGMNANTVMSRYKTEAWKWNDTFLLCTMILAVVVSLLIETYLGVEVRGGHR